MTSKERMLAALEGRPADHVPLTTWSFGFLAPQHLRWETAGREVTYWYSKRLEHIHTLPQPWQLEDEFKRAEAWLSLGVDDVLEVSVPWATDPEATWQDSRLSPGAAGGDDACPVAVREYRTPSGPLRHAIRQTDPESPGWVLQPNRAVLFEDYNIPRAVEQAVAGPGDVPPIRHLYAPPDRQQQQGFAERMAEMKAFADAKGLLTQAWSAFGMDAAVWLAGTQGAIMMAMDEPEAFGRLMDTIAAADLARTELAAGTDGVDVVCMRGWYSSTDFWSPDLFDRHVVPHIRELVSLAHGHGKKLAYVMTTGVEILGPRLADAGVDLLYFVDPVQDGISLEKARELFGGRMTVVGGVNSLTLACGEGGRIRDEVRRALDVLGPTHRFILHPIDAVFPDTPWAGVEQMIEAWRDYR